MIRFGAWNVFRQGNDRPDGLDATTVRPRTAADLRCGACRRRAV